MPATPIGGADKGRDRLARPEEPPGRRRAIAAFRRALVVGRGGCGSRGRRWPPARFAQQQQQG